jgi:hypothetical protein
MAADKDNQLDLDCYFYYLKKIYNSRLIIST